MIDIPRSIFEKFCLDSDIIEGGWGTSDTSNTSYVSIDCPPPFDIEINNWDKRASAMIELIETCPIGREHYIRNLGMKLRIKLINNGRGDLAIAVSKAKRNENKYAAAEANRYWLKKRMQEMD